MMVARASGLVVLQHVFAHLQTRALWAARFLQHVCSQSAPAGKSSGCREPSFEAAPCFRNCSAVVVPSRLSPVAIDPPSQALSFCATITAVAWAYPLSFTGGSPHLGPMAGRADIEKPQNSRPTSSSGACSAYCRASRSAQCPAAVAIKCGSPSWLGFGWMAMYGALRLGWAAPAGV